MDPISIIIGIAMNIYTLDNIDFFHQRVINEKTMNCKWEYVGKTKADPANASLTVFGNVFFKHKCEDKKDGVDTEQ